jgi:uncharacterized protein with ParB-like and HNH nuclease domain
MKADAAPILGIFEKKTRLDIPLYQRQYVWKQETHWEPLWEDIQRKFDDTIDNKNGPVHFLGAMVLDQKQTPTTHVDKRTVIDGQQRLTTFQIIIAAFRDYCIQEHMDMQGQELAKFCMNDGMMNNREEEKYKIWPTRSDRPSFKAVIDSGSKEALMLCYPEIREKYARRPNPRPLLIEAYLFFYEMISVYFSEKKINAPENNLSDYISSCILAMKQLLKVVIIDLDNDDDPQVIFETLNARGEPLLPGDLIRNYLFLKVNREGKDSVSIYEKYWQQFEDDFWRNEVRQGRLLRPRGDFLLQIYLSLNAERDISFKHLFVEYKYWSENWARNIFGNIEDEIVNYTKYANAYKLFEEIKQSDPNLTFLNVFDIGTAAPLFIEMLVNGFSISELSKTVEAFIVRRSICGDTFKNYNKIFLAAAKKVKESNGNISPIKEVLIGSDQGQWPNDNRIQYSLENDDLYNRIPSQRLQYIFKKIEYALRTNKNEDISIDGTLSIEHIMPQEWKENWPIYEDDPMADEKRNRMIGTIGNLTILTQPLNSAISNGAWDSKRAEIRIQSLLKLNAEIVLEEIWDENKIINRSKKLGAIVNQIWR